MPNHPAKPCVYPGCVALVHGRDVRYCPDHLAEVRHQQDTRRGTAATRGYDAKWRVVRYKFLKEHPICVDCGESATVAHHIIRRRNGGTDDEQNLVPLCATCHAKLHAKSGESFGGRGASESLFT